MTMEMSRYSIPWTPVRRALAESTVMLVSTAGVYQPPDEPFVVDGDLSHRRIAGTATASDLRIADAHYDHGCIDSDVNCVFPIDRLRELANAKRIAGLTEAHFSTGFTQNLRGFRDQTVPAIVDAATLVRPDLVVLTGGWTLCHRTVVAIQRAIEMQGIPTVLISVEPNESAQARPPRFIAPSGFRAGYSLGRPDPAFQRRILEDALALFEHPAGEPGTLVTRDYV